MKNEYNNTQDSAQKPCVGGVKRVSSCCGQNSHDYFFECTY